MISAAPEQSCTVSTETQKSICKPITVKILHAIGVTLLHPLLLFAIICIVSAGDISSCNPQLLSLEDSFFFYILLNFESVFLSPAVHQDANKALLPPPIR